MNRLLTVLLVWIAGLTACGTQQPQFRTRADPGSGGADQSSHSTVTTRRVWTEPVDFLGSPSPDGRLLSFPDWSTGNLGVRDLVAGLSRSVTGKRSWNESGSYAENSTFAPDGRRIAYTWFNDSTSSYELRLISPDGNHPRILVATKEITYFGPPAWAPNGRDIAVGVERADDTWQLVLVSVETGVVRPLKSLGWRGVWKLAFSPDGRFLAYDFPPNDESRANEVYLIATDGSREARITDHPAHDQVVGWAHGGNHLLFFSDREGTEGMWAVPVTSGRASGEPIPVRRDLWRTSPIGLSQNAFLYGVTLENRSLFVATVDLERAQMGAPPVPLPTRATPHFGADWSPDGESIAFAIRGGRLRSAIGIRTLESEEVREIPLPFDGGPNRVRWSPAGSSLMTTASQRGRRAIFQFDLRTGRTQRLVPSDDAYLREPELSPDRRTLYFGRNSLDGREGSLIARDLTSERERVVCRCRVFWLALSPDGQALAFATSVDGGGSGAGTRIGVIQVVSASGGEPRMVYQVRKPSETLGISGGLAWSRDGRYLLFVRGSNEPSGGQHELMVISALGGEARRLFAAGTILGIRVHPDGRRILFIGGEFRGEVWAMENLPAALQTSPSK